MNCGIMGLGTYIPDCYMTAKEIAIESGIPEDIIIEKFGIIKKTIPGENDTTSYMGIKAAERAIKDAGITSQELDIVLWVGGQHKDYMTWLAGVKVAQELGATNAWALDMSTLCGSMISGVEVAKSLLLANDKYNTILLVSGSRDVDLVNLRVPETTFLLNVAAGGSAMVIRKNYDNNVILGSAFKSDGTLSEECVVEYGGTKYWPIKKEELNKLHFTIKDIEGFKENLKSKTVKNFETVIKEALQNSGMFVKDINYLAVVHVQKSAHNGYLEKLGLTHNQTTYLNEYGHMGQNDQVLSIELGIKSGKIKEGSNIVMVGAGLGFVWAAAVVKWGRFK